MALNEGPKGPEPLTPEEIVRGLRVMSKDGSMRGEIVEVSDEKFSIRFDGTNGAMSYDRKRCGFLAREE